MLGKYLRQFSHAIAKLPEISATSQIKAIDPMARSFVDTYRRGKQIAYHRSMEMKVSVNTDTVTDTVCKNNRKKQELHKLLIHKYI